MRDIFGNSESCPSNDWKVTDANLATENSSDFENIPTFLDQNVADPEITNNGPINAATTPPTLTTLHNDNGDDIPKGRSLAHHHLRAGKLVFVSFDIETGGEFCGILQLSTEIARIELLTKTTAKGVVFSTGDTSTNIQREAQTFNSFINPGEGAIYGDHAVAIHGLHASHPSIRDAEEIHAVWHRFCQWIRDNVAPDKVIALVAYNGEICDLKWL